MVRTKFRVTTVQPKADIEGEPTGLVKLNPVMPKWDRKKREYVEDENKRFWDATPFGEITMQINNPDGFKFFCDNMFKVFYVDFSSAE